MESAAPSPILSNLRVGTAQAHTNLEAQVDIPRVCESPVSYRRLLEAFHGFYGPLEERLQTITGWEDFGFLWTDRAKTGLLRSDLLALGLRPAEIDELPRCASLPRPATLAEAFGCAYVLEGATLGGRQIVGILSGSEMPVEARHFFSSYREQTGTRWREFCGMLDHLDPTESDGPVRMATETFQTLADWLKERV